MESFYIGLAGSLVGGFLLAGTVSALFFYEKHKAKKVAEKVVNDLKAMYQDKLANANFSNNKAPNKIFN